MEPTVLPFCLENLGDAPLTACLIGAGSVASLKGRVLAQAGFKDITGQTDIAVTGCEDGTDLDQMADFIRAFGAQVSQIKLRGKDYEQITMPFEERIHQLTPPDLTMLIEEQPPIVGQGYDTGRMIRNFSRPFVSGPDRSLMITLLPGVKTRFEMALHFLNK